MEIKKNNATEMTFIILLTIVALCVWLRVEYEFIQILITKKILR